MLPPVRMIAAAPAAPTAPVAPAPYGGLGFILVTAAVGATIGWLAGKQTGAAIGALIGGGTSAYIVQASKGIT